jgi:hypothetical protein
MITLNQIKQNMEFSFVTFYLNPGKNFDFSYKLQHLIPEIVNKKVFSTGKSISQIEWEIYFWVSCSIIKKDFELTLESIGKKNKRKTFLFNFSYKKVKTAKEPVLEFVKLLFDGIISLNNVEYIIDADELEKAKISILKKIAENPKTFYNP